MSQPQFAGPPRRRPDRPAHEDGSAGGNRGWPDARQAPHHRDRQHPPMARVTAPSRRARPGKVPFGRFPQRPGRRPPRPAATRPPPKPPPAAWPKRPARHRTLLAPAPVPLPPSTPAPRKPPPPTAPAPKPPSLPQPADHPPAPPTDPPPRPPSSIHTLTLRTGQPQKGKSAGCAKAAGFNHNAASTAATAATLAAAARADGGARAIVCGWLRAPARSFAA